MKKVRLAFFILTTFLLTGCSELIPSIALPEESSKVLTIELLESEVESSSEEEVPAESISEEQTPEEQVTEFDDGAQWGYAYEQLDSASQSWYRIINASLLSMNRFPVELSEEGLTQGLTEENIDEIFQCVLLDHPEYFYVTGYQYTKYSMGEKLVSIEFVGDYSMELEEAVARKAEIEEVAGNILAGISPDASDYEKVLYVYETIIKNTEYNMDAPDNQNIYSVLKGGASVCQGYAKTTQFLLNRLGVNCTLVQGMVKDGEGHAWNMVQVDGEYYYVDTTWGDASFRLENVDNTNVRIPDISYDYLCVTTEDLLQTHTIDHVVSMPECISDKANYYVREGCLFYSYDENQITSLIQTAVSKGREEIHFKCADENTYATFKSKLIDEGGIFNYLGDAYSTVAYTQNDEGLLLTFWMTNE